MTTFKQFLENEEYQPVRIKLNRRTPPSSIQDQFIKNIHDEPVFDKDVRSQTHEMLPVNICLKMKTQKQQLYMN